MTRAICDMRVESYKVGKLVCHAIGIFLLCSSCNKEKAPDCFKSAGDYITIRRDIYDFTSMELWDYLQIELVDARTQMTTAELKRSLTH